MQALRFFSVLFLSFCIFVSCSTKKEPTAKVEDYDETMKLIFRNDSGLFHGANLGMKTEAVKKLEKGLQPDEEEDYYLSYSFGKSDTLHGTWYYNFEDGLDEVGVDIFREKQKECDWLFIEIKNYFIKRYGQPRIENQLLIWFVKNQGKEGAQITLADESKDYGYGKLTLTFFPFVSEVDPKEKEANP
jgi:hypothetical protein